mgnify:CR=1 FL=1
MYNKLNGPKCTYVGHPLIEDFPQLDMAQRSVNVNNFPLSDYKNKNFYFMATDSLDRFGTKLEKRFTKNEIKNMLLKAGFVDIMFSKNTPYWVAIAWKK